MNLPARKVLCWPKRIAGCVLLLSVLLIVAWGAIQLPGAHAEATTELKRETNDVNGSYEFVGPEKKNSTTKEAAKLKPGTCLSQGGRFPPFPREGMLPQKLKRLIAPSAPAEALSYCRVYRERTCCGAPQAEMAFVSVRRMIVGGDGSDECVALWEALECAICDPGVGTRPGPPAICGSFCDRVFRACRDAFFVSDSGSQSLVPCGPRDPLCSRASEWTSSGHEFCKLAGYRVVDDEAWGSTAGLLDSTTGGKPPGNMKCFDGNPAAVGLEASGRSPRSSSRGGTSRGEEKANRQWSFAWARRLRDWAGPLEWGENVTWLIAGLVLTAGIAYMRWRRSRGRRRRAAIFAAARSIQEARGRQQAAYSSTSVSSPRSPAPSNGGTFSKSVAAKKSS